MSVKLFRTFWDFFVAFLTLRQLKNVLPFQKSDADFLTFYFHAFYHLLSLAQVKKSKM